jgi:hypothetical protein
MCLFHIDIKKKIDSGLEYGITNDQYQWSISDTCKKKFFFSCRVLDKLRSDKWIHFVDKICYRTDMSIVNL